MHGILREWDQVSRVPAVEEGGLLSRSDAKETVGRASQGVFINGLCTVTMSLLRLLTPSGTSEIIIVWTRRTDGIACEMDGRTRRATEAAKGDSADHAKAPASLWRSRLSLIVRGNPSNVPGCDGIPTQVAKRNNVEQNFSRHRMSIHLNSFSLDDPGRHG